MKKSLVESPVKGGDMVIPELGEMEDTPGQMPVDVVAEKTKLKNYTSLLIKAVWRDSRAIKELVDDYLIPSKPCHIWTAFPKHREEIFERKITEAIDSLLLSLRSIKKKATKKLALLAKNLVALKGMEII